jgi:hypothetical protein
MGLKQFKTPSKLNFKANKRLYCISCRMVKKKKAKNGIHDKRQADERCVEGRLNIIIKFFIIGKSSSSTHAYDFSADGPWIFGLEMRWYYGSKFCMR